MVPVDSRHNTSVKQVQSATPWLWEPRVAFCQMVVSVTVLLVFHAGSFHDVQWRSIRPSSPRVVSGGFLEWLILERCGELKLVRLH